MALAVARREKQGGQAARRLAPAAGEGRGLQGALARARKAIPFCFFSLLPIWGPIPGSCPQNSLLFSLPRQCQIRLAGP